PTVLPEPLAPLSGGTGGIGGAGGAVDNIQPLCLTHHRGRARKGSVHLCPTQEVDVPPSRRAEKTSKVIAPPRNPQAGSGRRCSAACFQAATSPCAVRRMCSTSTSGRYRADPIPKPVAPFCTHECRLAACTPPTGISSTSSGRTVRQ